MVEKEMVLDDITAAPASKPNGGFAQESRRRMGQILVESAGLRPEQLAEALERQTLLANKHRYYLIGRILVGLGYVTMEQVKAAVDLQQVANASSDPATMAGRTIRRPATEPAIWQVATQTGPVRPFSALRALSDMDDKVAAGDLETLERVPVGFDPLDEALSGGIRPGELLLVGGGQGVGKTTMTFQFARNIAVAGDANCLYVCYEHDEENLVQRLIAMESVDAYRQDFRLGVTIRELAQQVTSTRRRANSGLYDLLESDPRTHVALQRLRGYGDRMFLLKASGARTTLSALNALVEAHRVRSDERLVLFVDYLQKVPVVPELPTEEERVTKVAEGLKELAMSHQIPVVAIVAADREGLKAKRMRAHHLWGGSALAYESDVILMLAEKYESVARVHIEFNPQKAEVFHEWVVCSLEKNRSGRDVVDIEFEKRFSYACFNPNGRFVAEKLIDERMYLE